MVEESTEKKIDMDNSCVQSLLGTRVRSGSVKSGRSGKSGFDVQSARSGSSNRSAASSNV